MNESTATGPLSGVRVIEFSHYIAAPSAGQMLVDQGADVIKVEPPQGESARRGGDYGMAMLDAYNRGKSMVSLDLRTDEGLERARTLISGADAVISNMHPAVLAKFGLDAETLRAERPELIVVAVRGYAEGSVYESLPGFDIAAQAESAMMALTGESDRDPQRVGAPVVDAAAGYILAQTLCAALFARERFGAGASIAVNLWDVAIHMQGVVWTQFQRTGRPLRRKGNGQPGMAPAADLYRARDGYVVVSAYMDAHWRGFCEALDLDSLVDDPAYATGELRAARRDELRKHVELAMANLSRDDVIKKLGDLGVVVGGVREMPEVVDIRGHDADSPFVRFDDSGTWYLGTPYSWQGLNPRPMRDREVGCDNDSLGLA